MNLRGRNKVDPTFQYVINDRYCLFVVDIFYAYFDISYDQRH